MIKRNTLRSKATTFETSSRKSSVIIIFLKFWNVNILLSGSA